MRIAVGALLALATVAAPGDPVKPGLWKSFKYDKPDDTPMVFSGWAKADARDVQEFCVWVDVRYANGKHAFRRCAYFDRDEKGWQEARGVFVPAFPVKRVDVSAIFRGNVWGEGKEADGEVEFRDFKFERREGTNELFVTSRYDNWPFADETETSLVRFNGRTLASERRSDPPPGPRISPIPDGRTVVWTAGPMRKISPRTFPGADAANAVEVALAGRERESVQLVLSTARDVEWKGAELEFTELRRADGKVFRGNVEWKRVGYIGRQWGYVPKKRGSLPHNEKWFADPLLPAAPMKVRAASSQGAWITAYAEPEAEAGTYCGEVVVKECGQERMRVPMKVRVFGFSLPPTFGMGCSFSLMDGFIRPIYGKEWKRMRREAQDIMLDHRLSPDDISRTTLPDIEDLEHARARGLNHFNILHLVPPPKDPRARWVLICKPEDVFNDKFYSYYIGKVKPYVEELRRRGLDKYAYIYGFDERHKEFYKGMEELWMRLRRDLPGIPLMTTAWNYVDYKESGCSDADTSQIACDRFCPVTDLYSEEASDRLRAMGRQVWWYTFARPGHPWANFANWEHPLIGGRIIGWHTWQARSDGFLYWIVNLWNNDTLKEDDTFIPGYSTHNVNGNTGGGKLIYPGERHILASIRLAQCRDSVEDYEYLQACERKIGREATMKIVKTFSRAPNDFSYDPKLLMSARTAIAEIIEGREKEDAAADDGDQLRFMWYFHDGVYSQLRAMGFNCIIDNPWKSPFWKKEIPDWNEWTKKLERYGQDGMRYVFQCPWGHGEEETARHPRVQRDGTPRNLNPNAASEDYRAEVRKMAEEIAARCATAPAALTGVQTATEVRDTSYPSFTPADSNRYFAATGHKIPDAAEGRAAPHWSKLADFPKDRVVDETYPLYAFYRWFWKTGDGWNGYQTMLAETFKAKCGRRGGFFTMYDPGQRTPPMWGSGGAVDSLNEWTYLNPDPCKIAYVTAEQQAMARESGKKVLSMIQAFGWRRSMMGPDAAAAAVPQWSKDWPNTKWPTMPPDAVQQGMWHLFSRRIDGIGFHGWNALLDGRPFGQTQDQKDYAYTHPGTKDVVSNLFNAVASPLGPYFRAVPERVPEVALLESEASALFCGDPPWDWRGRAFNCGVAATAASLSPYVIYEDEIARDGIPASVKVLLMPGCEVLTRRTYDAVIDFQARGGKIVADGSLCPAVKADALVADDFSGLAAAVAQFLPPHLAASRSDVLLHSRQAGTAELVFAINDRREFGDYAGPWRKFREVGLPNRATVSLVGKAGAVYDIVHHVMVPFKVDGGRTSVELAYDTNDGRALLFAPRPLRPLAVSRDGDGRLVVRSPDADVMIPVGLFAAGARPRYGVVKDGIWLGPVVEGAARVVNLADGAFAELPMKER